MAQGFLSKCPSLTPQDTQARQARQARTNTMTGKCWGTRKVETPLFLELDVYF